MTLVGRRDRLSEWGIITLINKVESTLRNPLARIFITAVLMFGAITAPIPFPWKVPLFALMAIAVIWLETGSLEAMGLGKRPLLQTVGWAVVGWAIVALAIAQIISPLIESLAGIEPDYSSYGALEGNLDVALKLLAGAFISAMIAEEIVYRGFFLHQLMALLGDTLAMRILAVLIGGIVFALPHSEQGPVGMTIVALTGMVFGWLFFRGERRNLFIPMLAHAFIDVWGVSRLYLGIH